MNHSELIEMAAEIEWEMFSSVENRGGKASCQTRPGTFAVMRMSQLKSWSFEVLESYYKDLKNAKAVNRNLCTEKYAYMMEFTHPDEYRELECHLPHVSENTLAKIREIVRINLAWEKETERKYPKLRSHGRPLESKYDSPTSMSVETYLFCELKTYSEETIELLYQYTRKCQNENINLAENILANTMSMYGFYSLEEAESASH